MTQFNVLNEDFNKGYFVSPASRDRNQVQLSYARNNFQGLDKIPFEIGFPVKVTTNNKMAVFVKIFEIVFSTLLKELLFMIPNLL